MAVGPETDTHRIKVGLGLRDGPGDPHEFRIGSDLFDDGDVVEQVDPSWEEDM